MSDRLAKVNALIVTEVGKLLGRLDTPGSLATVTSVKTSADLSSAVVWISVIPNQDEAWQPIEDGLPELQAGLAGRLSLKRTPRLSLRRDRSGEGVERIDQLLKDRQ